MVETMTQETKDRIADLERQKIELSRLVRVFVNNQTHNKKSIK